MVNLSEFVREFRESYAKKVVFVHTLRDWKRLVNGSYFFEHTS